MSLNFLIKPASSKCNMACKYCFYHSIAGQRKTACMGMLSDERTELLIKEALYGAKRCCNFGFQGGEPTLRGLDYFKKVIELEKKYNHHKLKIQNSLQTNGLLIDDEWCEFLSQNHFLVGISLDGPAEIHNENRITPEGRNSYVQVMRAVDLLRKHHVPFNLLSVVTKKSARNIRSVYRFLKKHSTYLQFIPCLEPLGRRGANPYALDIRSHNRYLSGLFDEWFADLKAGSYVSIRHIDNWLRLLAGGEADSCSMQGLCGIEYVVEGNGDIFPCDFYVYDRWKLGQIGSAPLIELPRNDRAERFVGESAQIPASCGRCSFFGLCRNGCKRERDEKTGKYIYCESVKDFLENRIEQLQEACQALSHQIRRNVNESNDCGR